MKNILRVTVLAICAIFMVANASAQVITAERASEIANQFFANGKQKSAAFRSTSATLTQSVDSHAITGESNEAPTFHILTGADGKGFVIVSGEETENPIIGYSFDGTINTDEMSTGMVDYLTDIDAQVKALRKSNAANPQKAAARSAMQKAADYEYNATSMGNIVKNLNTAPWGQHGPFNNLCKTTDGQTALTGCGPTAFAILCYYYKWPASGVGTVTHQGTGENMELGHTYDYASMLHNYSSGYTTEQADAVALLMRDLGWANQVGYGTSSTSFYETGQHMVDHFRFKSERPVDHGASLAVVRSTLGNDTQWKTYIKNCLDAGYPIPYASTTNKSNSARHIYILDGYTDNDYYHFNWGWSGSGNGWFTLDNMVPDDYSNYSNSHKAYFNLIPDATTYTVTATATPSNMGTVSINNGTAGSTVTANLLQGVTATLTAHPADGYALASWTKGGVIVGTRNTLQVPVGTSGNDYVANFADASTVTVIQDYTINATSGTKLTTGTKVQEWVFNRNNDYPAELKLTSTALSINTNNAGDCIQLYLVDKTSETFTLSVPEDYVITKYTIRCKTSSTYITSIAAEGQTYTPTKNYADYTFTKNAQARGAANSSELTIVGSANRALMVEAITVTVAKEGANVPSTPTTYTINVNAETGGNAYVNGTNTSATVDAGTDVTLQAYPDGTNYTFAGWYNGNSWVSSNNPYTFALNSNVTYTAKFNAVATTYTVSTTANPAAGGTAKFAVGTGSQKTQGDVENGTQITLYATANTGYNFVNWTLGGNVVSADATCNVRVAQASNYVANFESNTPTEPTTSLAGKYFRLKEKSTGTYMNIYDNNTHGKETRGGVNVTTLNKNNDGQIFQFIESGTNYKLQSKTGYYITWAEWNVNADSKENGADLTFEPTAAELEYFISCTKGYFKIDDDKGTPSLGKFVYCDAAQGAAATWVLEEVVYYTVTATAGEGGSVSPLTSTIEKGKSVTLTATANEGYRFVNWTLNGNVVSTDASYTFNATAAGEYVANFEISTYTISATTNPGTAGSVTINGEAVSSKNVNENSTVTLVATPQAGYYFVNWTNGTDVVSTDATYTFTATADTNLEANFEKKIVNVTLRDDTNENIEAAKRHVYEFVLDNLEGEATTDAIAAKLMEKYPVIESLGSGTNTTLIDNGTSYTYTNSVKLQFLIANGRDDDGITWYNIYYPVNINNQPNYLAASSSESTYVEKINDDTYAYGANPTYNKEIGNAPISWAIYSVDHTLTFALKNKVAGKFIQVTSVATGNAQNAVFTNEANATAFAISKKTINPVDYYAFAAEIDGTTGYLSSTDNNYDYATLFNSNDNPGAWAIVEDPAYYTQYIELLWGLWEWFAPVDGLCTVTKEIQDIKDALNDYENITLNTLKNYGLILEAANLTWPTITLDIKPNKDCGATNINGEEGMTSRRAPADYVFPVEAIPAEGYHFTKWTDATDNTLSTDAKYFTSISGKTGDVTTITANFEINIYNINVTAGEGGSATASSATVEHGSEVTLTATPSTGYEFIGWYNGEELVDAANPYTFTATSNINYTARFNEVAETPSTYAIHITVASTDGTTVTNNATGNVKAVVELDGQDWVTDYDCPVGSNVKLIATNDYDSKAYLFDGWYKNDVLVSNELEITVKVTEAATYEARFFRGCIVIGEPKSSSKGYVTKITLADGTSLGYDASNRAVVKPGTTVKINTYIEKEYEVGSWTDKGGNVVGNDKDLIIVIHNDATYTANIESAFYYLTVRANDDNYGTAEVILGTAAPATTVKVNKNMSATITATANNGYYFVNWTKGGEVVSTSATYEIAGIANVENLIDVEYVANFLPVENAVAGVYYRIGYDYPVAAANAGAARTGATRAAGDVQTLTISFANGSFSDASNDGKRAKIWTSNSNSPTVTLTATSNGIQYRNICNVSDGVSPLNLSLDAYPFNNSQGLTEDDGTTFTIAVDDENYKITAYSISYSPYSGGYIDGHNNNQLAESGLNVSNVSFTVKGTGTYSAVDIQNFTVTIQQVGGEGSGETPETPANRYYIQSVASNVSGKTNALLMTKETGAASIFYYADSKLLSYDKGTYVKEDGGTRGLQAVGVSGTVTITTSGETTTIAAPSYLHAIDGTTRYVDHCGSNPDNHAANHNFVLEEVTTLPVTISSALHATFYAPVAVEIPEGVRAYVLKEKNITTDTWVTMTLLRNGIIPANTGVILRSDEAKTYYFDITENTDEARAEAVGNILEGTVAKTYVNKDAYILTKKSNGVGMYPLSNNSYITGGATATFTNNSHKAYLPVEGNFAQLLQQGTGFRFVFDDDGTTEIEDVEREVEDTIYDLQGRKLSEITEPGIYIVGGKKVWVK